MKKKNDKTSKLNEKSIIVKSKLKNKKPKMPKAGKSIINHQVEEMKRLAERFASINSLSSKVSASLSVDEVISAAIEGLTETVKADVSFIFLRENEKLILKGINYKDSRSLLDEIPEHKVGECMCGLAVKTKTALFSKNIFKDLRCTWEECKKAGLKSFAALPLFNGNDVVGVVGLSSKKERNFEPEAEYLETLSKTISIGIANALLYTRTNEIKESLAESEEHFRALFENSIMGIYRTTPSGKIINANPALIDMLGYNSLEELVNRNLNNEGFEPSYSRNEFKQKIEKNRIVQGLESVWIREDGTKINIRENAKAIRDSNGEILFYDGTVEDITERKVAENMLLQSEDRYRDLVENSSELICTHDLEGNILSVNNASAKVTGYSHTELLLMNMQDIIVPEYRKLFISYLDRIKITGKAKGIMTIQSKTGERRIWEYNNTLRTEGLDKPIVRGMVRDITEQKQAEELLRSSEAEYRTLFENVPVGIGVADLQGNLIAFNDAMLKPGGYTSDDIFKIKNVANLYYNSSDREKIISLMEEKGSISKYPVKFKRKDGSPYDTLLTLSIVKFQHRSRIQAMVEDITDRKIAQEELKLSEEKFNKAFRLSPIAMSIQTDDNRFVDVNDAFIKLLGYQKDEIIGRTERELNLWADENQYKQVQEIFSNKHELYDFEFIFRKKNGKIGTGIISSERITLDNKPASLSVVLNITEDKRILAELITAKEKAEQSDKLKSEFLAQMSHEIRSPINVTLSMVSIIKDELGEELASKLSTYFNGIDSAGKRLIRTIDLILNTSEIQMGAYQPTMECLNLSSGLLEKIVAEFSHSSKLKGLELSFYSKLSEPIVMADKYSVTQIFANLLDNALKYTNEGSISVTIDNDSEQNIQVIISDTGIGMSQEFITHVFEPFTQEERGYTRRYEGNGLGLALVKKYCDLNGVNISVETEKGKGCTFYITFPKNKN